MLRKRWILPIILILVLGVTACAKDQSPNNINNDHNIEENEVDDMDSGENQGDPEEESSDNVVENNDKYEFEKAVVTKEEAFDAFKENYPEIQVQKIELDKSDGEFFYKVKGYDGKQKYKLKMNLADGSIRTEEKNDDKTVEKEVTREDLGKVESFLDRAIDDLGDGYKIHEWELKAKKDRIEIEIELVHEIEDKVEYEYDLDTGELLEID